MPRLQAVPPHHGLQRQFRGGPGRQARTAAVGMGQLDLKFSVGKHLAQWGSDRLMSALYWYDLLGQVTARYY